MEGQQKKLKSSAIYKRYWEKIMKFLNEIQIFEEI